MNIPNINLSAVVTKPTPVAGARRYLLQAQTTPGVFTLQIDNSSLEVFTACARSAEYKLVHARDGGSRSPLTYGGAIHNGLEVWYRAGLTNDEVTWTNMILKAEERYAEAAPVNDWRTFDRCIDTLARYVSKYPTEAFEVYERNGTPQVELPFSLPLQVVEVNAPLPYTYADIVDPSTYVPSVANLPVYVKEIHVYWTGKMDLMINLDNALWVMDHKTTSIAGPSYFREYELAQQTIGYCWAAQQIYGQPVTGLLLNAIIGRPLTKTGTGTDFQRQRYYYRPDQLEEWNLDICTLTADFIANLTRGFFPRETKWCVGKYGVCPYFEVCTLPPTQRLSFLSSDYFTNVTWSPLAE